MIASFTPCYPFSAAAHAVCASGADGIFVTVDKNDTLE